jgi:hypothetical protein
MNIIHPRHLFSVLALASLAACGAESDEDVTEDELTATPVPGPIGPIQPMPLQPDLIVNSFAVTAPPVLHCGSQSLSFTAVESNIGPARAGTHNLHLQRFNPSNGQFVGASSIPLTAIAAGATRALAGTFNFWNGPCDCFPTNYTITFRLFDDGGDLIAESNEANNASNSVVVAAACP